MVPMTTTEFHQFAAKAHGTFCFVESFDLPPGTLVRMCHVKPNQCIGYGFTMVK